MYFTRNQVAKIIKFANSDFDFPLPVEDMFRTFKGVPFSMSGSYDKPLYKKPLQGFKECFQGLFNRKGKGLENMQRDAEKFLTSYIGMTREQIYGVAITV